MKVILRWKFASDESWRSWNREVIGVIRSDGWWRFACGDVLAKLNIIIVHMCACVWTCIRSVYVSHTCSFCFLLDYLIYFFPFLPVTYHMYEKVRWDLFVWFVEDFHMKEKKRMGTVKSRLVFILQQLSCEKIEEGKRRGAKSRRILL